MKIAVIARRWGLILIFSLWALGCTQAETEFELLGGDSLPRPLFSGSTVKNLTTSSDSSTFNINGECDSKIKAITGLATGTTAMFSTLNALTSSAASITCRTDGKFSFTLKSLVDLGYVAEEGKVYEIQLRGVTSAGLSQPSYIRITYASPNSNAPKRFLITSGGTESGSGAREAVSSSFKAQIRLSNVSDATQIKSGTSFTAKIGAAAAHD
ncbi:MAG: hypothetical protein AB7G93_08875 [Bdellovibrionales bacterium]